MINKISAYKQQIQELFNDSFSISPTVVAIKLLKGLAIKQSTGNKIHTYKLKPGTQMPIIQIHKLLCNAKLSIGKLYEINTHQVCTTYLHHILVPQTDPKFYKSEIEKKEY